MRPPAIVALLPVDNQRQRSIPHSLEDAPNHWIGCGSGRCNSFNTASAAPENMKVLEQRMTAINNNAVNTAQWSALVGEDGRHLISLNINVM